MPEKNVNFISTLIELRNGAVADEAGTELAQVVQGVIDTGKPGEFSLKLKVSPHKVSRRTGEVSELLVTHNIGTKIPQDEPGATLFFADDDGKLMRDDPAQMAMFAETEEELENK